MTRKLIPWVLLSGLALMSSAWAADPSLIGWWKLDDGSGTTALDSSGKGLNGTLTNGPTWSEAGKLGSCLVFDGTDDYIVINGPFTLPEYTLALWFKITGGAGTQRDLLSFEATGQLHGVLIEIGTNETMRYLHRAPLGGSGDDSVYSTTTYTDSEWHHLAAIKSATNQTLYLDGVEAATLADTTQFNGPLDQLYLGVIDTRMLRMLPGALDDVRVYNRAIPESKLPGVMKGGEDTTIASKPDPAAKATDVPVDAALTWAPGEFAQTHDVYFGTVYDDVNTASKTDPKGVLVSQGQSTTSYDPAGLLDFGQTYYWRVDEVNAPPTDSTFKGRTWNFTAETYGYRISTPIKATASSFSNILTGPDKTIDGSGLNALDQHSTSSSQMWLSKKNVTPIWIQYEFDSPYKLYQMWVWNQNQLSEPDNGVGAQQVTIETSIDGITWTALEGVPEFAQGLGEETYVHNTTVDFGGVLAKFVKLNIISNWGGLKQAGLSEVRFFYVPVKAYGPTPVSGTTGVAVDKVLNWRPGRTAASHEVYLGTDPNALAKVGTVTEHRYGLSPASVEYDRTYYWKVNEVNAADTWEGDVWSFSTPGYVVVDDFESYDDTCNRIFYKWADGYGVSSPECGGSPIAGNGSGSTVGNVSAPYAERTVVHGGRQSMPMAFDNAGASSYSEATRTFEVPQDWMKGGIKTLVLYFHGAEDNAAGQMYVKINNTKVVYNGTANVLTIPLWRQWNIDLASVGGNLRSVISLAIGVSGSGKGVVYVDDILLYRSAPAVVQPVDPGTTGLSAYYMMDGDMKDSSSKGYNGTLIEDPIFVDGQTGFGKALQFDGTNDHVELPIGTLISSLDSATFATWVNFDPSTASSWQRIFDFGSNNTNYLFLCPRSGTAGVMRFAIRMTTSAGESGVDAPATLPTGWHHVAVVIDGAARTLQLCLDGQIVRSGTTLVLPKDLGVTNQNWLGRSQYTADGYFKGTLDEFRIYNRALSEGEVRYLAGDR
jgi:hypothetical protein